MQKFFLACYQKSNSIFMVNGGKLLVTQKEYIIKYWFRKVAVFDRSKTLATKTSFITKGIHLSDGAGGIDLYFFPGKAKTVYDLLGLR